MSLLLALLACADKDAGDTSAEDSAAADTATDDTAAADSATRDTADTDSGDTGRADTASCVEEPSAPETRTPGAAPRAGQVLAGQVTWSLTFDATARAAGHTDCTYTRTYATMNEVTDLGWLCPDCTLMATGEATVTDGYDACTTQISSSPATRTETLGVGNVDGVAHFWRSGGENLSLGDMGPLIGDAPATFAVSWSDEGTLDAGGGFLLEANGTFSRGEGTALVTDPATPRTEPFTGGWPTNDPGGPNPAWQVATGAEFPNFRLPDANGEGVALRDLRGYYVIVDASAPDCGPCQLMASEAEAFKARMAEACLPVELVTVLAEGLSAVNGTASAETRAAWAQEFGLTSPVLGDRGFGYAMLPDWLGRDSGMSFPSIAVVAPDGTLLGGQAGFGGWDGIEALVTGHAGVSIP